MLDESAERPFRYYQITDHHTEGQLFQIEFRDNLFDLQIQNEIDKPIVLTLTQRHPSAALQLRRLDAKPDAQSEQLESAVIEAAIEWREAPSESAAIEPEGDLLKAVDALIAAREKQNGS